jgi:TolB-like protein
VQSAGDRIRINAQLIDAYDDEHLWAQTYDRELTAANIFEVQTEIARAISAAMHTTLTPQDEQQLAMIPT